MEIEFSSKALDDLSHWQKSGNGKVLKRIRLLIEDMQLNPYYGMGKPEALKYNWSGYWSRRITDEHRLIYKVEGSIIVVAQLRYHY